MCEWKGTVGTLEEHLGTCLYARLPCPKGCKDGNGKASQFMRKDLADHLVEDCPHRDYKCPYCGEDGTYMDITDIHDVFCDKKIVNCYNSGCLRMMERCKVVSHVAEECDYMVIPCKYKEIGCAVIKHRLDMPTHEEDDKFHLHMAIDTTLELKKKIAELELSHQEAIASVVQQSEVRMTKLEEALAIVLNIQSRSAAALESSTPASVSSATASESAPVTKAKKNPAKLVSSFEIKQFNARKAGTKGVYQSPAFVADAGRKMSVEVDVSGKSAGTGKHISVVLHISKGKKNESLSWPLVGEVIITLLNQLQESKNHYLRSIPLRVEDDVRPGTKISLRLFVAHGELAHNPSLNTQFLKDNTLKFGVYFKASS